VYCAKTPREKRMQRALFFFRDPDYWPDVREALREAHREDLIGNGPKCLVPHETKRERERSGSAQHYPGKAPPHLRGERVNNIPAAARHGGDGWGTNSRDKNPRRKRYEEDHGMPKSGAGCGGGQMQKVAIEADSHPRGEGGELEWMS
jgi:hypothetical protein